MCTDLIVKNQAMILKQPTKILRALMQRSLAPNLHMVLISQKNKTDYGSAKVKTTISSPTQIVWSTSQCP